MAKEQIQETAEFKHIVDENTKSKYVHDFYGEKICNDEIENYDVWVITNEEDNAGLAIVMLQHIGEKVMIISHIGIKKYLGASFLSEQNIFLHFYIYIETYYVNKNINNIQVYIPKNIRGFTIRTTKIFRKVGFMQVQMAGADYPDGAFFLTKFDLKKWYDEVNGKYKARIKYVQKDE